MTWVLLPGMDGTGDLFQPLLNAIKPQRLGVVVRYPRTRILSRGELRKFILEALPVFDDYILIAESFSGPLAIEIASAAPNRMKGLVLVATFAHPPVRRICRPIVRVLAPALVRLKPPALIVRYLMLGSEATELEVQRVQEAIGSISASVFSSRLRMILDGDARNAAAKINIPVLLLAAERDRLVSRSVTRELIASLNAPRVIWIDSPHLICQTRPDECFAAIHTFEASL